MLESVKEIWKIKVSVEELNSQKSHQIFSTASILIFKWYWLAKRRYSELSLTSDDSRFLSSRKPAMYFAHSGRVG